jgi:hypothetical protein
MVEATSDHLATSVNSVFPKKILILGEFETDQIFWMMNHES